MKRNKYSEGPVCPYCGGESNLKPDSYVYSGTSYGGKVWVCENWPKCQAFVGVHRDGRPLGMLANRQLREARIAAHDAFDPLWQSGTFKRRAAYQLLAVMMNIPVCDCHIGMFDEKQCKQVLEYVPKLQEMALKQKTRK